MQIKLLAFGIAKEILNSSEMSIELGENASISDLKNSLISKYPEFQKLRSLKFAINEDYQSDEYLLNPTDEVVIIPPVSGG